MNKVWTILGVVGGLAMASTAMLALEAHAQPGNSTAQHSAAHKHANLNGHDLLGANIKRDGKHALGKLHDQTVTAEVTAGKVANMTAGNLTVKRVKSPTKMADGGATLIRVAYGGSLQLAQYDTSYYGYCFDDGYGGYTCYWYPASDVYVGDYTWVPYDPYY